MNPTKWSFRCWVARGAREIATGAGPYMLPSALCFLLGLVAGCSLPLPQAQSDATKFYVLSATDAGGPAADVAGRPAVRIRPIDLASYLRSRPMAVRHGPNEIEFREFARWGEPLEQGIARVLREDLLAHHAASAVQIGALRPSEFQEVPFELNIRVLAAEGDAGGAVNFEAVWQLVNTADSASVVASGDFRSTSLRWTPRHEASLAAALSRAVDELAANIGAHLPK